MTVLLCTVNAHTITLFTRLQRCGRVDFHNGHPIVANIGQALAEGVVPVDVVYSAMSWIIEIPKRPFTN
jgi:hypothetical protein